MLDHLLQQQADPFFVIIIPESKSDHLMSLQYLDLLFVLKETDRSSGFALAR